MLATIVVHNCRTIVQHSAEYLAFKVYLKSSEQAGAIHVQDHQQLGSCGADPVHGLPTSWGTKIRTGGLAVILLRAGLKIDKLAFVRAGKVVLRLALIPMLCEAIVDGGCYYWSVTFHLACSVISEHELHQLSTARVPMPFCLLTGMQGA